MKKVKGNEVGLHPVCVDSDSNVTGFHFSGLSEQSLGYLEITRACIHDDDIYDPEHEPQDGFFIFVDEEWSFITYDQAKVLHEWLGEELKEPYKHPQFHSSST